jgi:hypothetical protein
VEKQCVRCKKTKPLNAFAKHPKGRFGRNPQCKERKNAQAKDHYAANKDAILARQRPAKRQAWRRQKYGLTDAEHADLLARQGGKCAFGHDDDGYLMVDHDHVTGQVRGLLCRNCNWAVGLMADDPARLRRAAEYLELSAAA